MFSSTPKNHIVIFILVLCGLILVAQTAKSQQTYCNPLNLNYRFMVDAVDAREAADPVIILFKDDYYLFASRSGGYWTSTDLRNWTLIIPTGVDIETYAPAVLVMGDTVYYYPSASGQIYKTADPKSGVWMKGPAMGSYSDPDLFLDDGRLYMFNGCTNTLTGANIRMVELDPKTFREIGSALDLVFSSASIYGWERRGDDNLLDEQPWIEGSWMSKINNKYYLQYAAPGTEFKTYADGIYVSSDSAKGPYQYAPYSPFSFKPTGFVSGAGHSCTFQDKDGHYWHISTMTISVKHMFERRLGLFPVAVDADGNIHCNTTFGDYPQYFPGIKSDPVKENFAGMLLLSHKKYVTASSSLEGYGIENAVDENIRTYWSAQTGDPGEWMLVDLGTECDIQAIQVNFAEHNTDPILVRGRSVVLYERYTIEKSNDGMNWDMLIDKSQNTQDVPDDYVELAQTAQARYLRITNVFTPGGGNFAIRDLRVFGNSSQAVFTTVPDFTVQRDADGRNAVVRWSSIPNADGYVVRYGVEQDKLYNSYMVYDADSVEIHSLNKGVDYYYSVEAFDSGTDYYKPMGEFRSFKSGNWNDVNTWSKYNGSEWINPAPGFPTTSDGPITILNGDTITVTASDSADQIIVASGGFLVINPGVTFLVKDGIGTDLIINGCLMNSGSITKDTSATISFLDGSKYLHLQQNGSIPSATWAAGSTCEITDYVSGDLPSNLNQTFYNFTWNCTGQSATADLGWFNNTINGTVTVKSTGNQKLYLTSSEAGTPNTITINGNIVIEGGQFSSNGSSNSANITINTHGNVDVTGGNFSVSLGTGPTVVWNLYGNFSMSNAATQNSNPSGAKFIFGRTDTLAIGPGNTIIALPIEVSDGATLNIGTNILTGAGIFILRPGATLESSHPGGLDSNIQITGTRIFDKAASYTFNGSAAQVTGKSIPDTVNNLTINNPAIGASVTLLNSVTVNGTLEIKKGALALSGNVLSYGVNGTLKYSGTSMQTSTDTEFPSSNGPKNLLIANTKNVALHASRTILGNLNLSGKLTITVNTLVANSASNTGTSTYVVTNGVGVLKLTSLVSQQFFPVGTSYAYAPIWISNAGVPDTFGVTVNADEAAAAFGGRIKVKWTISENTEGGGDYAIKFGWMGGLENTAFKSDRIGNARIFFMTDTTEAGTGDYTTQFETAPYSVSRGGITKLGPYAVGKFRGVTGVPDDKGNVPRKFNLSQNFPNPFNPSTTIRYCLPVASSVKVIIYNMLGAKVRTIVDSYNDAGDYSIVWDGTNDQNNLVSSGIYFYCLTSNGFSQTMKMLLVR